MLIETERLVLRPIGLADLDEFVELHGGPEVTRFVRPLDRAAAEKRLELAEREWGEQGYGMLAVLDRAGERFLGRAGLKYWPQFEEAELGWVLRKDAGATDTRRRRPARALSGRSPSSTCPT
jgi:RimJ/RimL family protein N-acetyltransferase